MLSRPKNLAPEPEFSGYLLLLSRVFMWLRAHTSRPDQMSADELRCVVADIHLLAEALQNVPTFLREMGGPFTPETMRDVHLASYDKTSPTRAKKLFQLKSMLESALAETTQKLVELGEQPKGGSSQ